MDLSNVPQSLNASTQELQSENDTPSVVTLIQDLAFVVEEASGYLYHPSTCATMRLGGFEGCDCGLEKIEGQIEEVLMRAKEARK